MAYDIRQVKVLCTVKEFSLYRDSLGSRLEGLSPWELQLRLRRARVLRDKYEDVYERQRGGARGKMTHGHPKEIHDFLRTRQKAGFFAEAMTRFELMLRVLEDREQLRCKEALLKALGEQRSADEAKRLSKTRIPKFRRHRVRPTDDSGPHAAFGMPPSRHGGARGGMTSARLAAAHFRSANKRFQARRDSR